MFCIKSFRHTVTSTSFRHARSHLIRKWGLKNFVLFAVGVVVTVEDELLYKVRFYDGHEDVVPREEVYYLTQEKFSNDVNYIVRCEESLVGQAVVARNDMDGLFYLGEFISFHFFEKF